MTDSYTTDAYIDGTEIRFDNNIQGLNYYNVDLTPLLSGKTNNTDFYSYTASTQTLLNSKVDDSTFISYTANTLNILNTKVDSGINLGGGGEIFSGITGTDMYFRTLSGGSNTTLTTVGDVVKIDVDTSSDNFYVTGGTYSSGTTSLDFSGNTGFVPFSVNVSELIDDTNTFVTGFTYNDTNTFTISDNNGTNYSASIDIMSGLTVNGNSVFSGTTDVVTIYGSGSTSPTFRIEGSSGELFSVTDSLIGQLFAVNDISGIPILQVHSDNRIILGDNLAPSLYTTAKVTATSGSLTSIYSIPLSAYTGAWFEYTAKGATSLRAGNIASIFSGTSISHNETTTTDIGDTSDLLLDVIISGTNATLTASATTSNWEIKTIIRSI